MAAQEVIMVYVDNSVSSTYKFASQQFKPLSMELGPGILGNIFDGIQTWSMRAERVRALKRIFILCDQDRDSALSDEELNDFQVLIFGPNSFSTWNF
ncbi:mitochondrial Rho GTPase 1-like protein [Tanacetum coccineum]